MQGIMLQIAEFLYLLRELKLPVLAVKGYQSALKHVFSLAGANLAASKIFSRMFSSFKKTCPPRGVKPLEWNLSVVLRNLTHSPYKPLKLSLDKHPT